MRRRAIIVGAVVAAVGAASATHAPARPAATYKLSATKTGLKFTPTTIRARAGRVTLSMANPSSLPHAVGIKGKGKGRTVRRGGTSTYTTTLRKGAYTFYCPVPGHEAGGMKGRLVVR